MFGLNHQELKILKPLNTPIKIQNFLDTLKINFELNGDTCLSPRKVLQEQHCHCIEAAMLAALALRINNQPPLLVDMKATSFDLDHVITVFKQGNHWGAISKSNHAVLRYREPIYKSIRELIMSYFNEYTDDFGRKTLRSYSIPLNLTRFNNLNWPTSQENLWKIAEHLDKIKHYPILSRSQIQRLRKADKMEIKLGQLTEYPDPLK